MAIIKIIVIFLIVSFGLFVMIEHLKIIYRRHLKTYKLDIESYLKKQKLTFQTEYYPNKNDWNDSPFEKPKKFNFSLINFSINGIPVAWNDRKHKVIQTKEGNTVWLEIDTTYFKKPDLIFEISTTKTKIINGLSKNKNTLEVKGKCPACGFQLTEKDFECLDCGLNLR